MNYRKLKRSSEETKEKFSRLRKRREEKRLAEPAPDYPPIRIPGALVGMITLRNRRLDVVTLIEIREPARGRKDQYSTTVNGKVWPKTGRPVGMSAIRGAITF